MTYGITTRVHAPMEMYDAVHAALLARTGTEVDGLLLHVGRAAEDGFEVVEVWESRDHLDHYNREVIAPLIAELTGSDTAPSLDQQVEEFEVRGLLIPHGGIGV